MVIWPLLSPKQPVASTISTLVIVIVDGEEMVIGADVTGPQPFWSVTSTVYVPSPRPVNVPSVLVAPP